MLVSVYIRKEDEQLWRDLDQKAEAVHNMLHAHSTPTVISTINTLADAKKVVDHLANVRKVFPGAELDKPRYIRPIDTA